MVKKILIIYYAIKLLSDLISNIMNGTSLLIPTIQPCNLRSVVIVALLSISLGTMAQNSVKTQPVSLPSSELRRFHSEIMDQDLLIYVQLPLDYISDGSKKYPV